MTDRIDALSCAPEPASLRCPECGLLVQTVYDALGDGRYVCAKHLAYEQRVFVQLLELEPALGELFEVSS